MEPPKNPNSFFCSCFLVLGGWGGGVLLVFGAWVGFLGLVFIIFHFLFLVCFFFSFLLLLLFFLLLFIFLIHLFFVFSFFSWSFLFFGPFFFLGILVLFWGFGGEGFSSRFGGLGWFSWGFGFLFSLLVPFFFSLLGGCGGGFILVLQSERKNRNTQKSAREKTMTRQNAYGEMELRFCRNQAPGARQAASEILQMLVFPTTWGVCKNAFGPGRPFWGRKWPPKSKSCSLLQEKWRIDSRKIKPFLDKNGQKCPEK